ncbi:Hypothetical predicted protein [Paramuricea clavata]|uniref:Uncharacterized protein n=1 Tax=Paramuricea clavata TaxID=317549 RepID=A0A6S7FGG9_PARCT|nr:Hypothetical predicted protein [Paramuricea clavata]
MFFILLFFVFLCEFSGSSRSSWTNGANFHEKILSSLNVTELNVTTLNVLLTKLKLQNCSTGNTNQLDVGQRCVPAEYLFETHKLDKSKKVSPRELAELSTSLLYVLLPENVGATFRRFSQNGDNRTVYELFLQYYQTNGHICARLLDIILRDLKREFRDSVIKQKNCFSAVDLFKQMNLSTEDNELDREQFHIISIMIISHLLNGRCLNVTNDLHDLPCRSYFTSNLLGSDGLISFDGFKEVLESIGLGNESNHDDSEEAGDDHDHLRKRCDTSDNSGTSPPLNTPKHCYSANDLAEIFLVNKSFGVDSKEFSEICPALIQQLKSNSCVTEKNNEVKIPSKGSDNHAADSTRAMQEQMQMSGAAGMPPDPAKAFKAISVSGEIPGTRRKIRVKSTVCIGYILNDHNETFD